MECLYLEPKSQSLLKAYELFEDLNNLRPVVSQKLLEASNSIKVKRLFLYMGDKGNHDCVRYLDLSKISLGSGKHAIIANGVYVAKYQITVPTELK
ncbi:type IV toxin-antitoxin system AbiEi family antitoxin domain-containing protein [Pseudidiomarina aestuarii]|uniref:type IV toxin-antitoxin system AbiEi family antitoxin domain-containing protein n=1 Tax=Pseudidiomarina aestuarii TaxID=624146 RepID=UPI003A97FAAD